MKRTAIAIWGNADQGKSSSIKEVLIRTKNHFPQAIIDYRINNRVDIQAIVLIGKIKIGVESQGDPGSRLASSLQLFIVENCDIIVCSCRTKGKTVGLVNNLNIIHRYNLIWSSNYYGQEEDKQILNELFADHILLLIAQIIHDKI